MSNDEATTMPIRYAVLYHDIENADTTILSVWYEKRNALEFLMECMTQNDEIQGEWYRKESDDNDTHTIYRLGYVFKKRAIGKYMIRTYSENTEEY